MALIYGEPYNYSGFIQPSSLTPSSSSGSSFSGSSYAGAAGGVLQLLGVLASASASKYQAKFQKQGYEYQAKLSAMNADYTKQSTLLGSNYAQAMGAINANSIRYTADVNARIAELGAQSVLAKAEKDTASLTLKAGQLKSSQKASMAANGVDLGVGNAAEVQASTDIMKEIDMNTLKENAVRDAWGYRTQAASIQSEGIVASSNALINANTEAMNIKIQGDAEARNLTSASNASYAASNSISPSNAHRTTLTSGLTSVADSWYRYSRAR